MASINEDKMLADISEDVDNALIKWMTTYEVPPLNLTAIILARLTWLAKMGDYRADFVELLKSPEKILEDEKPYEKVMH